MMVTGVESKKNSCYWEIVAPEPFVIDPSITDEQFITEMVSVSKTSEITDLIHSYLQKPTKSFVVFCTENELKKIFNIENENYRIKIEKQENGWLISVINNSNEFIGRGEIINLGDRLPKDKLKPTMCEHMSDFINRYDKGNVRIKALMYKMELIKNKMSVTGTVLS